MPSTYKMIINILVEKLGFVILDDEQDDFAISEFITDSLEFIKFIIAIEEELGRELPDDFLLFDILSSAKGLAEKLDYYLESLHDDNACVYVQKF